MRCSSFPVSGVRWLRGKAFCNSGRTLVHAEPVAVMYRIRVNKKINVMREQVNSQLQQMRPPICFM